MKKVKRISALILMLIMAVTMLTGCDNTDYIATVKAHTPFLDFPDITYGEVMDKYLENPVWEEGVTDGDRFVKVSGKIKGLGGDFALCIYVKNNNDGTVQISMDTIFFNGEKRNSTEIVQEIMYGFFDAYNQGLEDMSLYNG